MLSRLASTAGTGEGRFVSPVVTSIAGAGLLMGVILLPTVASQAAINSSTWLAKAWQSDDGLPDNSVSGIAQTPDGYLWIGTLGGLARFDGATGGFSPHFETDKSESAGAAATENVPGLRRFRSTGIQATVIKVSIVEDSRGTRESLKELLGRAPGLRCV